MTSWNEFARENEQRIEGVNNTIKNLQINEVDKGC